MKQKKQQPKECLKKTYPDKTTANQAAKKINGEKPTKDGKPVVMRTYKCQYCNMHHLTTMDKQRGRYLNDLAYRNDINEKSFIKNEARHWNKVFGIET